MNDISKWNINDRYRYTLKENKILIPCICVLIYSTFVFFMAQQPL